MSAYLRTLRNYDDFNGRARRKEYWLFALGNVVLVMVAAVVDVVAGLQVGLGGMGLVGTIVTLAILVPQLAVGVRRLHDSGRSGWWLLVSLVPVIGALGVIAMMLLPGTPGPNDYGPDPRPQPAYAPA